MGMERWWAGWRKRRGQSSRCCPEGEMNLFPSSRGHIVLHMSCLLITVRCWNCHSHVCAVACLSTVHWVSPMCVCSVWRPRSSRWSLLAPPGDKCASPTHSSCLRPGLFTCPHNTDGIPLTRKDSLWTCQIGSMWQGRNDLVGRQEGPEKGR